MRRQDVLLRQALDPQAVRMRAQLGEIIDSASREEDFPTAWLAGRAFQRVLQGQLHLLKFLDENTQADAERAQAEMGSGLEEALGQVATAIDDPPSGDWMQDLSAARQSWMVAFDELVQVIQRRDELIDQKVQPQDRMIADLSEEIKLSLKADQDRLGPRVQQGNAATGRAVLSGLLLAASLATLIAVWFVRTINKSVIALGLSEAETERLSREIKARKETERRLEGALEEVERVNFLSDIALELTGCGYWHVDYSDPEYYYLSPRAARILGEPLKDDGRYHLRDEWLARLEQANPEIAARTLRRYQAALDGRHESHESTYPYQRPLDGKIVWVHALGKAARDGEGIIRHLYGVYQDVTQRVEAESNLQHAKEHAEQVAAELKRGLNAAARVQQSLLPTSHPDTSLIRFAWRYLPCDELAGDYLNFFALDDNHIAAYVVDVSGHGVASSLLSVTIGRMLTSQFSSTSLLVQKTDGNGSMRIVPPAEVAGKLNRRFPMSEQNGLFFTMLYGVLDLQTREFRYVSAGHEPVVHVPSAGTPGILESSGVAIGWLADAEFAEHVVTLQRGDRLYLYSDGVPEAINEDLDQFTRQQMLEVIECGKSQSLDASVSSLLESVQRWSATHGLKDDVSILGLEFTGDNRSQMGTGSTHHRQAQ